MKAGVLHARDDIRYEEVQTPEPKAGEVLVKVKYKYCSIPIIEEISFSN